MHCKDTSNNGKYKRKRVYFLYFNKMDKKKNVSDICNYPTHSHNESNFKNNILFLGCLTVAAEELVNATSSIDKLALTSIERVRSA